MDDGVSIAATLYVPDGTAPPGGWPAIVFLHGLSGNRQQMNALVEGYGFVDKGYAILTFDARGHGESGGLVGIDGPREVADTRAIHDWLAARPDVSDAKIGAWGISYGGGAVFNSLVAGVPWAAVVTVETWTDLYSALMPQGLVKSGLVAGLAELDPAERSAIRRSIAVQAAAFAGNTRGRAAVGRGALEPLEARLGHDARLHGAGPARLPVRHRPGRRARSSGCAGRRRSTSASTGTRPRRSRPRDTGVPHEPSVERGSTASSGTRLRRASRRRVAIASEKFTGNVPWARGAAERRLATTFVSFPGRHDLRPERQGRAHDRSAPQGDRGLRLADGADLHRRERRLVATRRGAHGPHAEGRRRSS